MKVVEILINNQQIDILSDSDFPLILANNVYYDNEVNSRGGEYSYTVQFPFTINNSNIFNLNNIYEQPGKFYRDNLYDSIIYVNSIKVFQGVFSINSFNRDIIEGSFKSNNIAWASLIGNKTLQDIKSFDDYPFLGMLTMYDNMTDQYLETNPDFYNHNNNYDLCFPLVAYGQYYIPYFPKSKSYIDITNYSGLIGAISGVNQNVYYSVFNNVIVEVLQNFIESIPYSSGELNHLDFQDIPPSFYLTNIVRKIFKDIDYEVSGSWISDSQVNRLILPSTMIDKPIYNWQTLCDIDATLLTDLFIYTNTNDIIVRVKTTQRNNNILIIPPTAGNPNIPILFPTGILYSMTCLGARGTNTNGNLYVSDTGFNSSNPLIYNDFFVPEDGLYELTYNVNGTMRVLETQISVSIDNPNIFSDGLIGFFYIQDITTPANIIETIEYTNYSNIGGIPNVQIEFKPFISAIPGSTYFSTYDPIGYLQNFGAFPTYTDLYANIHNFSVNKTVQVNLKRGDILRFMVLGGEWSDLNAGSYEIAGYEIKIDSGSTYGIKNISGDIDLKIAKNLPKVSQLELIKGLISMFNLYFTVDINSKIISFEKRDNFYLSSVVSLDLTNLCDIKESTIEQIQIPCDYIFNYKEDNNDYLSGLDQNLYKYTSSTFSNNQDIQEIECIFSDTRMKKYNLVLNKGNQSSLVLTQTSMLNPTFMNQKEIEIPFIGGEKANTSIQFDLIDLNGNLVEAFSSWKYNNNIRILKISNEPYDLNLTPLVLRIWNSFLGTAQFIQGKEIPRAIFVEEDNTYLNNFQLDSLDWESLYNKNWYNFILNQQRSERLILNAEIDFNTYNMLNANRLIKVAGNYYFLEKFSGYNVINNEMTQLSLIKRTNS